MSNEQEVISVGEKIAVHCKSANEWFSVEEKAFKDGIYWCGSREHRAWWDTDRCINIEEKTLGHAFKSYYEQADYKIITAQEYLGGKDVKEFEVGDRVEGLNGNKKSEEGTVCEISPSGNSIGVGWDNPVGIHNCGGKCIKNHGHYMPPEELKLLATKPKTTKENNMSININSTVAKVFKNVDEAALVTKWVGGEYEENNHRAFMDLNKNSKTVLAHVIDLDKEAEAKK